MADLKHLCEKYFGKTGFYEILGVSSTATDKAIRTAYYHLSLALHPDRVTDEEKLEATEKFKIISIIHSTLADPEKRELYDTTGVIGNESVSSWKDYWRTIFPEVTEEGISSVENSYIGSEEEMKDLKNYYMKFEGKMNNIMECLMFGHPDHEERYNKILKEAIDAGDIPPFKAFTHESEVLKQKRRRKYELEQKRANKRAKMTKKEEKSAVPDDLIQALQKRQADANAGNDAFLKSLEEKYCSTKVKGKKNAARK